jgi:hypothetical protein
MENSLFLNYTHIRYRKQLNQLTKNYSIEDPGSEKTHPGSGSLICNANI